MVDRFKQAWNSLYAPNVHVLPSCAGSDKEWLVVQRNSFTGIKEDALQFGIYTALYNFVQELKIAMSRLA